MNTYHRKALNHIEMLLRELELKTRAILNETCEEYAEFPEKAKDGNLGESYSIFIEHLEDTVTQINDAADNLKEARGVK